MKPPPPRNRLVHPHSGRLQVCAFLSLLRLPVALITVFLLVIGFLFDTVYLKYALAGIGFFVLLCVAYFMQALNLRCAVCTNPVFLSKRCTKNRDAKRFFGISYSLQVAWNALLSGFYRCMYCGEKVKTEEDLAEYQAFEEQAPAAEAKVSPAPAPAPARSKGSIPDKRSEPY